MGAAGLALGFSSRAPSGLCFREHGPGAGLAGLALLRLEVWSLLEAVMVTPAKTLRSLKRQLPVR